MYFKRLEIFGFKSFAEKTIFNFEPGITAIVGPNGCGKSNVFDAIRWVLGEQSVKQLRGSAMEDVIFNGTDTKLALGFAEVSVVFDNQSRTLSVNADEVVITRRLFRSGESEYLINKEVSRLKDVAELFMGTGVGAEAYSLVQQGKVDLVVSAKPDDRRMIFDEAAGITKYKAKKREAQNKLEETDANLLRINDIVVEVKRQISSIERQAQKAQRYKEQFEKLKTLERALAIHQLTGFGREKAEVQEFLSEVQTRDDDFNKEIASSRQVVERDSLLLEELAAKVQTVREEALKNDNQIELQNRQIGFNEERIANLGQSETKINEQKKQLVEKCRLQQEKIAELERMLAAIGSEIERGVAELEARKLVLAQLAALIQEYQDSTGKDEEALLSRSSRQVEMKNHLTEILKESQGYIARRRRLEVEQMKAMTEKEEAEKRLQGISQGITDILAKRSQLSQELDREKGSLARYNDELASFVAHIDSLEKKKLFLISQKEFIEKMQVQYTDMPDPVINGRFLSAMPPAAGQSGFIGKIKEVMAVDPSRLEALKAQFGNFEATTLYEIVCETKYVELDPQAMAEQINAIDSEIQGLLVQKEAKTREISERSVVIERILADIHAEEKRLSVSEAQQNDVGAEARKIVEELGTVNLEIREADEGLLRLQQSERSLQNDLKAVEDEIVYLKEGIKTRQEAVAEKSREREAAAVALAQAEAEIASLREREKSWCENRDMFRNDLNGYLGEISNLDAEMASFTDRRESLLAEIANLQRSIEELKTSKGTLKAELGRHEAEEQDVAQRLNSVRSQIAAMEKDVAQSRELLHERQMRLQQIDFQEQAVKDRMSQRYNIDASELAPSAEALPAEGAAVAQPESPAIDSEALKAEIQTLAKKCDAFGAVNLVAIEEFDELKNRFQFLTKQQSDLLSAKDSLEQTIRKINRTTRELFTDTFVKVNEQFRIYFRMLFNGGEAQLILVDPENALESGIEIVARPPGKKLQTISLLSGGEKTMTAIALIFSVFRVNPSPFCVLDEIDAALDEANVDRFATVLKEFAKIAQFIVITHNKKTIAYVDVMYGITMQQTGVSRVVSVKLSARKAGAGTGPIPAPEPAEVPQNPSKTAENQRESDVLIGV
jgi:chromosome segregation protein